MLYIRIVIVNCTSLRLSRFFFESYNRFSRIIKEKQLQTAEKQRFNQTSSIVQPNYYDHILKIYYFRNSVLKYGTVKLHNRNICIPISK